MLGGGCGEGVGEAKQRQQHGELLLLLSGCQMVKQNKTKDGIPSYVSLATANILWADGEEMFPTSLPAASGGVHRCRGPRLGVQPRNTDRMQHEQ